MKRGLLSAPTLLPPTLLLPTLLLIGCGKHQVEQFVPADQVADFGALFEENCSGCHGHDGRFGAARPLNDPVFLELIGQETLKERIANGVPKTSMPAFSLDSGGGLTDRQISILASQMEQRWSRPQDFSSVSLPPYRADLGDPKAGETVFNTYCSGCHGEAGGKSGPAGSPVDPSFLALASDQSLRTTVIAGRSDRGMPNWRSHVAGHVLTPTEVSDVVAWLSSHRAGPFNLTQKRGPNLP